MRENVYDIEWYYIPGIEKSKRDRRSKRKTLIGRSLYIVPGTFFFPKYKKKTFSFYIRMEKRGK